MPHAFNMAFDAFSTSEPVRTPHPAATRVPMGSRPKVHGSETTEGRHCTHYHANCSYKRLGTSRLLSLVHFCFNDKTKFILWPCQPSSRVPIIILSMFNVMVPDSWISTTNNWKRDVTFQLKQNKTFFITFASSCKCFFNRKLISLPGCHRMQLALVHSPNRIS